MDTPKSLASLEERRARVAMRAQPHVQPLEALIERLRAAKGPGFLVPSFDPCDGGVAASALFLLEAPGPKAVASGFVSRNNPDETARNFLLLCEGAALDRRATVIWNAVPWYLGSAGRIRAATRADVRDADRWLGELLSMLGQLRAVVFVGKQSLHARPVVEDACPRAVVFEMPHPSPMCLNRHPGRRQRARAVIGEVAAFLASGDDSLLGGDGDP